MIVVDQKPTETWRVYTKRLAKLNQTNRRRIVKALKRRGR